MAVLNVSLDVNQLVDVSLPGVPVPNSGVFLTGNPSNSAPSIIQYIAGTQSFFQFKALAAGTASVFIATHNAANTNLPGDQINFIVSNPLPDATGSGITVSAPHS